MGVAIALPPPTISELFIDNDMFVTRMSPDFKTIYCEPRYVHLTTITKAMFSITINFFSLFYQRSINNQRLIINK